MVVSSRSLIWDRSLDPKLASKAGGATVAPPTIEADSWPRKRSQNRDRRMVHATSGGLVWAGVLRCSCFPCLGFLGFWVSKFRLFGFGGLRVSGLRCSGFRRPIRGFRRSCLGCSWFPCSALFARVLGVVLGVRVVGVWVLAFGFSVLGLKVSGVFEFSDFEFLVFGFFNFRFCIFGVRVLGFRASGFSGLSSPVGTAQAAAASGRHRQPPQAAATGSR